MSKATFRGGVHPYDGKDLSKDKPIVTLLPTGNLVYPMSQHIGAPAKPIVAVGDKVLAGQRIADAGGFISSCINSSVSGTVKAIEPRLTVSGAQVESIIIENDNEYKTADGVGKDRDFTQLSKQQIRDIVKDAGIVGMGGAGFPTHVKLTPKDDNSIDYVIVNGSECEPYLTSDYRVMLEEPKKLYEGLRVILRLFDKAKGVIAIEDNKPEAIAMMQRTVGDDPRISVLEVHTKYPEGAERQLIYAATNRRVNSSMLPADAGCVVNNVDTVVSIYMAVCKSTPLMRRIVTVTGDAVKNPCNYAVRVGTLYKEVLEAAGGFKQKPEKVISGGPMMGMALFDLEVPVTKTSSALLAFLEDPMKLVPEGPCIRCGRCVSVCPSSIIPQRVMEYSERFDDASFEKIYGMECMECGSCTYVCPAGRKLTQSFKQSRRSIMENRKKK